MHEDGGNLQTDTCWLSGMLDTVNFQTHPVNMDECGGGGTSTQIKYKIEPTDADMKQQNRSVSQCCCDFTWRRLNIGNSAARGPYRYQFNLKMIIYDITDNEDKSTFRNGYSSSTESSR